MVGVEEVLGRVMDNGVRKREVMEGLWEVVRNGKGLEERRKGVMAMRIMGCYDTQLLSPPLSADFYSFVLSDASSPVNPDLFLLQQSLLLYHTSTLSTLQRDPSSPPSSTQFLSSIEQVLLAHLGTYDLDWFSLAETYLNVLFGPLKFKNRTIGGSRLIQQIVKQMTVGRQ